MEKSITFKLKARYFLVSLPFIWYLQPGANLILERFYLSSNLSPEWYWNDLVYAYYFQIALIIFLLILFYIENLSINKFLGRQLNLSDLKDVVLLDLFLYLIATALITIIFTPISFVLPEFISWWLEWIYAPIFYITYDNEIPILANVLSFISLVIIAPITEELIYRGYLLNHWSRIWGIYPAVIISSAIFGALHPDPLGAAIFGIGMSILYLKTQSLYVPIIAHALYNFIVWIIEFLGVLDEGFAYYKYELEQFQADWWWGALSVFGIVLMIDIYLRRSQTKLSLKIPAIK